MDLGSEEIIMAPVVFYRLGKCSAASFFFLHNIQCFSYVLGIILCVTTNTALHHIIHHEPFVIRRAG